jgi:hypothetical protein
VRVITGIAAGDHSGQMTLAFRLLREAAEAAAVVWSGAPYLQRRRRARRQLCQTLDDLRTVSAELAAADQRSQLQEFSRCMAQAWRIAQATSGAMRGEPSGSSGDHGDVLRAAARLVVAVRKQQAPGQQAPAADIIELLGAVQALTQCACELADGTAEPVVSRLYSVCDRLIEAADHLQTLPQGGSVE